MLNGLMMDEFPLTLRSLVERAEQLTPSRPVVSRRADGSIHRTTFGECAERARRGGGGGARGGGGRGGWVGAGGW
jgi:fatty-acyl-CoA synthase